MPKADGAAYVTPSKALLNTPATTVPTSGAKSKTWKTADDARRMLNKGYRIRRTMVAIGCDKVTADATAGLNE